MPRWNFINFMHSFMIVFRVLCGEWIESMWDCMLVGDWSCIPFFLATVVIGNLVVLNLFLALLLSNFGSSNLSAPTADSDTNKIAEAFDRISRFSNWIKQSIRNVIKTITNKLTNQISDQTTHCKSLVQFSLKKSKYCVISSDAVLFCRSESRAGPRPGCRRDPGRRRSRVQRQEEPEHAARDGHRGRHGVHYSWCVPIGTR